MRRVPEQMPLDPLFEGQMRRYKWGKARRARADVI